MDKAYFRTAYESVKYAVGMTERQREIFEAWLHTDQTLGQLAVRFSVNRSTICRAVHRVAERVDLCYRLKAGGTQ